MTSLRFALFAASMFLLGAFAAPAHAQGRDGASVEPAKNVTLAKLGAIQELRCDAKRRAKAETLKTNIYTAEMNALTGPAKMGYKAKVMAAEANAAASYEEAGSMKRRLDRMVDGYVSARRLDWYKQVDEAEKIHLEEKILLALEIQTSGCASDRKPKRR
jgi:hypothetical protein